MSYIPKYILKRMLPKDCVKAIEGGIEISLLNVISPITIEEIPDNAVEYLDVIIDGNAVGTDVKEKLEIDVEGETVTLANLKNFVGRTLPVGGKMIVKIPLSGLNSGEEHEFNITIKTDNPFNIKAKRIRLKMSRD